MDIRVFSSGVLHWNEREYRCAIGKNGVTREKTEGDAATPIGCFSMREVLYRADMVEMPVTDLPVSVIEKNDGWCDETSDPSYNKRVELPYPAHHEELWRKDSLYDIVVPLGYNDNPPLPGKGSAIFMHVAIMNYAPTAGCVALSLSDLREILKEISLHIRVCIEE